MGPGHVRRYDRADTAAQHSQTQRGFAPVLVGEHAAGKLRDHVSPEERSQHQPLGRLVPVEFQFLKTTRKKKKKKVNRY